MPRESKWENVVCKNDIGTLTLYEGGSNSKCASENALWSVKFMGKTDGVVKVYPFVIPPEVYVSRKNNARKVKLLWKACYSDPHTVHQNELIVEFQDDVALDTFVKMIKLVPPAKSFHYENIGPSSTLIIDALVYDVSKSDRKVITYITPQLARDVFFQYPATLLAYKETVLATPQRLSDEDFWRFFCSSHYFTAMSRVNASLQSGSSKIVNTAHDELSPFLNEPRLLFEYFEDRYRKCSFEYGTNNSGLKSYYSFTAEKTIGFGTHLAQFLNRGDSTTIPESVEKISDLSSKIMNTSSLQSETICTTSSLADEPPEPKRMKLHPTSSRSENHRTVVFFYKARPHDLNNALQCLDTWIGSPLLFNQDTFNTISNCYHFHGAGTPEQSLGALQRSDQTCLPLNAATNHFHLATRALTCCRDAWMHKNEEQDTQIDEILQHIQEHQDSGSEHSMLFPSLYSYLRRMLEKAKSKRQRLNIGMGWNEA